MTDIEMSGQHHPVDDEDTIMHDVSMLPAENSQLEVVDSSYDPMDISPLPMVRDQSSIGTQPEATVPAHLTNPSSRAFPLGQNNVASALTQNNAASATPRYNGRGFFSNVTRSPFIRVAKRFSPRSPNPYLTVIDPAKSVLRPLHLQNQTPIDDPIERMKRMFRPREKASVMGNSSGQIPENKTVEKVPENKIAEQVSEDKTTLHLEVKERPANFDFPFRVHELEESRKRCYKDGPAHPCNYQVPEVPGHVNTKYRRVSINDFPASAIKANDKEKPATPTAPATAPNEPSSRAEPTPSVHIEPPHSSPAHDHRTSPDRATDAHVFAQNGDRTTPIATAYHVPGAWPESTPDYDHIQSRNDTVMTGAFTTLQDDIVMTNDNETPQIHNMDIDESDQGIQNMDLDQNGAETASVWHGYWQAAYQGTTKAVGTLLNFVRDAFSSAPSFMPVVDRTFSIFRRRRRASPERRRGSRESSPTHQQSTARASLRSLTEEQRHKIRCHKWRSDRGLAGPTELPFPQLHIQYPSQPLALFSTLKYSDLSGTTPPKRAKNPKFTHKQKQKRGQTDKHRSRHESRNAKGNRSSKYGVHKRSGRTSPRKQSTAASTQPRQAWVQPMSPNVHRRVFFAHTPPRRYPELAEKERQYAAWRNGLGDKRKKELEAQAQEIERAAAAARQKAMGPAGDQRTSNEKEAAVRQEATGPAENQFKEKENQSKQNENQSKEKEALEKKDRKVRFAELPELATEIAPHLRPVASQTKPDEEEKENIAPVTEETEKAPEVTVENEAPHDTASESETEQDPWLRLETPFGRPVSAVRLFGPNPEQLPPGRTESIYAAEWRKMQEEEKRNQSQTRIRPDGPAVRPLSEKWEDKVSELKRMPPSRKVATTLNGDPLSQKDLATCYTPLAWLNDEVINSYLALIIEYLRRTHNNAGRHDKPRFHAFNSFFFANLRDKGYDSVRRWATRAKIGGETLLDVDTVFVPVHHNAHWTLIVVKPMDKTIEHFDSLGPPSRSHIAVIKSWLREELGPKFRGDQWTALPSRSPQQNNGCDCGTFLLSTAKAVAIGLEPLSYGAGDIPLLRRRIVAELMAGRLEGEFDPTQGGEVLL